MHVSSTNASRQLNHFLRWTSFEERLPNEDDHILLISFVYHCQSFLISHEQSVKEGLFVILSFLAGRTQCQFLLVLWVCTLYMQSRGEACPT